MANVENINNEQTEREYVHCTIPKWAAGRESAHRYTTKEGQPRMSLTLPPHTNVTLPNGETLDASFYKLDVPAKAVHEYENDAKNYSVGFPVATKDGEPWEVTLTKQNGCWEHPGPRARSAVPTRCSPPRASTWIRPASPKTCRSHARSVAHSPRSRRRTRPRRSPHPSSRQASRHVLPLMPRRARRHLRRRSPLPRSRHPHAPARRVGASPALRMPRTGHPIEKEMKWQGTSSRRRHPP